MCIWQYSVLYYYAQQHLLLYRILAVAILSVCLFVHLSVHHTVGSVKNSAIWDHQIFIVGCLED